MAGKTYSEDETDSAQFLYWLSDNDNKTFHMHVTENRMKGDMSLMVFKNISLVVSAAISLLII